MLFMTGGPSQLDMFDPKPALASTRDSGRAPSTFAPSARRAACCRRRSSSSATAQWRRGQRAAAAARQRHRRRVRDSIDVHLQPDAHAGAGLVPHRQCAGNRPSMGSWISYGLGSENENLPSFVALGSNGSGPQTRSAFLPTEYQGVGFQINDPDPEKIIPNLRNKQVDAAAQRADMDALLGLNQNYSKSFGADSFLEGRIKSMETAYRMQFEALELFDIRKEPESIREEYGNTAVRQRLPARAPPGRGRRALRPRATIRAANLGRPQRRQRQPPQALPRHGPGGGRADSRSEAPRPARRDARRVGRRVRPHARLRKRHGPRPQSVRLHDVGRRRRLQGRPRLRRHRRVRLQGRARTASRSTTCTRRCCISSAWITRS